MASLLGFGAISACPLATHVICPYCVDGHRDNAGCEWVGDTTFPIETQNPAHQRHLIQDAHLAEGLAVRFADAEHKRLFGTEHHGGLIDNGRVVRECLSRMASEIASHHSVTGGQIEGARATRHRTFDIAVGLLFMPLYWLAATVACRALTRRFSPDERHARMVATALTAVAVALLGCYAFVLWSMPWEGIRVGNGHIGGYRLATYRRHSLALVSGGAFLLFWLVALLHRRVPWPVTLTAATLSCTILAAMFARTFATGAAGYIVPALILLAVVLGFGLVGDGGAGSEAAADDRP